MTTGVHFLAWLRSGLAAGLPDTTPAQLDTAGSTAVSLPIGLVLAGDAGQSATGTIAARLHGPGDVLGLSAAATARTYPPDGAIGVERSWFPYVEFSDAQLPWMLSTTRPQRDQPAPPDARRGLAPWLTLVVVPSDAAQLTMPVGDALGTLTVAVAELPDLADAWLWAHAQITIAGDTTVAGQLAADPSSGLSRLLCARRLMPDQGYTACVVPTTGAGVKAGLGKPPGADDAALDPAWSAGVGGDVTLPVYHFWTFSVGDGGDVRSLVEALVPADVADVGMTPIDIGAAGNGMPGPAAGNPAWLLDLEGELVGGSVHPGRWDDAGVETAVRDALADRLGATGDALLPPLYGGAQAGVSGLPAGDSWLRALNTDPRYRAAAAQGARLVRAEQEQLMTSAWEQVGAIDAANQLLRTAQLGRTVGTSTYAATVAADGKAPPAIGDAELLQITAGVHDAVAADPAHVREPAPQRTIRDDAAVTTVADVLRANGSAAAAAGAAMRRLTHPTSALATRATTDLTPLTRVADPGAPGGATVVPPLTPVVGTSTLPQLSPPGQDPVRLRDLTAQVVARPRLPWELATELAPAAAVARDALLPAGYLSDVWAYPSAVGRLVDWDGKPLGGWSGLAPPTNIINDGTAPAAIYRLEFQDASPYPALAQAVVQPSLTTWGSYNSWQLVVSVQCLLRGDIPGLPGDSPIRTVDGGSGMQKWPVIDVIPPLRWGGTKGGSTADFPQARATSAVATADLDGTKRPSVVIAYAIAMNDPSGPGGGSASVTRAVTILPHLVQITDGSLLADGPPPTTAALPAVDGDVKTMAIASGRLYIVIGRRMFCAPIALTSVGAWSEVDVWDDALPSNWADVALCAADFTGDGNGDLAVFVTEPIPAASGATARRGELRICHLSAADGSLDAWSDAVEVAAPITADQPSLLFAEFTAGTTAVRQQVTAAFRAAAEAVQAHVTPRVPAAPPADPPPVDLSALAGAVRTAIDPTTTVAAAVTGRVSVPDLDAQPDPLAPLLITPSFPEPLSERLLAAGGRLVPGLDQLPDDSIAVLVSNPAAVEAFLAGANSEFGHELHWRGFPARTDATYFDRFWSGTDGSDPGPDISDMSGWTEQSPLLGHHGPPGRDVDALTVVVIRGRLLRQWSELSIGSAPAIRTTDGKRTVDLGGLTDPLFTGRLSPDTTFVAFAFDEATARGDADALGRYLVFAEHPSGVRFGLDEPPVDPPIDFDPPAAWRATTWAQPAGDRPTYDALRYATGREPRLRQWNLGDNEGENPKHHWGYSAADMAHITARPPALIVVHLSVYLPAAS